MQSGHLLDQASVNEVKEAKSLFTIFDDMVESYVYLDHAKLKVSLANPEDRQNCHQFTVQTEEGSQEFYSKEAY